MAEVAKTFKQAESSLASKKSAKNSKSQAVTVEELVKVLGDALPVESRFDEESQEWSLEVQLGNQRRQQITVSPFSEGGREMIRLITEVGRSSDFSPQKLRSALDLNSSLLYGALAIYQGAMVLTETFPLACKNHEEIVEVVRYMTRMGDSYEKMLFGLDRA